MSVSIELDTLKINHTDEDANLCPPEGGDKVLGNYCPINVLEFIFSLLDPRDLCACAQVNWYWNAVSSQDFIWAPFLAREKSRWNRLTNQNHTVSPKKQSLSPFKKNHKDDTTQDVDSYSGRSSVKQTYLSYHSASLPSAAVHANPGIISRLFSSVTRRYKFALFGSGLEVPGSKRIAQSILNPIPGTLFTSNGFYSGNKGVGSGVCVRMSNQFNLIVCFFYSNFRDERNRRTTKEHYSSVLFDTRTISTPTETTDLPCANSESVGKNEPTPGATGNPKITESPGFSGSPETEVTVKSNVREAFQEMDGLIYVVNSEAESNWAQLDKVDLHLLQSVCEQKVPLLVLSSIASADKERIACADMIDVLSLNDLSRPWLINDVTESSLGGVEEGMLWLIKNVK